MIQIEQLRYFVRCGQSVLISPEQISALLNIAEAADATVTRCDMHRNYCLAHRHDAPCPMAALDAALDALEALHAS
jgi:hypothetical protein